MFNAEVFRIDATLQVLRRALATTFTLRERVAFEDRIAELEAQRAMLTDEVPFNPMTDEAWEAESQMMAKLYGAK
jgi:hypothetical protein